MSARMGMNNSPCVRLHTLGSESSFDTFTAACARAPCCSLSTRAQCVSVHAKRWRRRLASRSPPVAEPSLRSDGLWVSLGIVSPRRLSPSIFVFLFSSPRTAARLCQIVPARACFRRSPSASVLRQHSSRPPRGLLLRKMNNKRALALRTSRCKWCFYKKREEKKRHFLHS